MSLTPPNPGLPSAVQSRLAGATLNGDGSVTISGAVYWLMLESNGAGGMQWALSTAASSPNAPRWPISGSATFTTMRDGTINSDGSVTYGGTTYWIRMYRTAAGSNVSLEQSP